MRPIGRRKSPKRRQRRMKQGGFEEAARLAAPSGDGNRNAATVYAAMVIAGQCPPLSSSQSRLSSVSLAVTSSASLVPAMLARTRSLRCSDSPHHAGRGGDPNAKTAPAPLHPKGTSAPTPWAWALLLSPPCGARRDPLSVLPKEKRAVHGPKRKAPGCALVQWPSALKGGGESVPAPIWPCLRAR